MTTPVPITVIDLMRNIAHIRMSDGAREKMRQMLHKFAAEQRAAGAAEVMQQNKDLLHSVELLREENARLRRSLVNCALAVGAVASDRSSIDFLELIPEEVRLCFEKNYAAIEQLRAELAAAKESEQRWHKLADERSAEIVALDSELAATKHQLRAVNLARESLLNILMGINNTILPRIIVHTDGKKYQFRPPEFDPWEILQSLSDRIRAIPDEIYAAIEAQKNVKKN